MGRQGEALTTTRLTTMQRMTMSLGSDFLGKEKIPLLWTALGANFESGSNFMRKGIFRVPANAWLVPGQFRSVSAACTGVCVRPRLCGERVDGSIA